MTEQALLEPHLTRVRALATSLSGKAELLSEEARLGTVGVSPDPDVNLLADTLRLWAEFLSNTHVQGAYAERTTQSGTSTWVDENHVEHLENRVRELTHPLDHKWAAALGNEFRILLRSIVQRSDLLEPSLPGQEGVELLKFKYSMLIRLQELDGRSLERSVVRANQAAAESEKGRDASARAASKVGEDAMSTFYAKLAESEADNADKFRRFTVGFAIAGGALALIFVLLPTGLFPQLDTGSNDWARVIQKTVLITGIFGIAGYFARQAHQHRSMANWAESLSVQLQTFDAYVAAIESTEVKDELRRSFAARAFGDHPAMKGEPTVTPSAAAMDTAVGWAAKLTAGGK